MRTIQERIGMVRLFCKFENAHEVQRQWANHFGTAPPDHKTISATYRKFLETGSVADAERCGRPVTVLTDEFLEGFRERVEKSPQTSIRRGMAKSGMSYGSYQRALHEVGLKCYHPQLVVELSETDFDVRVQFSETILSMRENDPRLADKICWSDESQFRLDGQVNKHNCTYWATANPELQIEIPNSKQGVQVWCGMTSQGLIGPFFFDGNVRAENYLAMLTDFLWPAVTRRRLYFQQDGAPAHYAVNVRAWLDLKFKNRWIGRRGPIEWPPRSPDLTPCDFFLWGYLKDRVYSMKYRTLEELKVRIREACATVTPEMCKRVCDSVFERCQLCIDRGGQQLLP
jgi:hypothetical protein